MTQHTSNNILSALAGDTAFTFARRGYDTALKSLALLVAVLGVILGAASVASAQAPAQRLYVADYSNSRVAVFDPKNIKPGANYDQINATPTWIQTGAMPFGVLGTPDGRRVYTANYASDNVTVIDTMTQTPIYNVPAGDGPYQLALSPDTATLYVSDFDGKTVTALNVAGNTTPTQKWTLQLPYSPTGMAVTPDGHYLFVNLYQDWKTVVVDLSGAAPQVKHEISVGPAPVAITMSKDGTRVYVANEFDEQIQWGASLSIIDSTHPESATQLQRLQLAQGASPRGQMALSSNGRWLFIAEGGSASVTVIDLSTNTIVADPRTFPGPLGAVFSPDESFVYSSNEGNGISIIDTGNFTNRRDILVPFAANETPARFECMALVTLPSCP